MGEYHIKKFDLKKIPDNATVVISARRGSGKSTLMSDILYTHRHIPAGIVCSATEDSTNFYGRFVPQSFIYNRYDDQVVQKLLERQKRLTKERAKNSGVFCLLDDIAYDKSIFRKETIRAVFLNGRHLGILLILSTQFSLDLPPALRSNSDYIFVFQDNNVGNQKRIYDNFCGVFPSFSDFQRVFNSLTKDYCCMVIDMSSKSNRVEDTVFWYKAKPREDFKIGASVYWKFDKKHTTEEEKPPPKRTKNTLVVKS